MPDATLWHGARRLAPPGPPDSAVLLLHGLGSNADDLIELAPHLSTVLPNTLFVSPNAPEPCDMAPFGHQWFSLREWSAESMWHGACRAAKTLEAMIADVHSETGLNHNRIALVGFSQGAMMSLHVALRLPEALGAVVGLSGALIGGEHLTGEIRSRPPVLLAHGQLDPVVPYGAMIAAADILRRNNVPVETETRPHMAHSVDEIVLQKTADFLVHHLGEG